MSFYRTTCFLNALPLVPRMRDKVRTISFGPDKGQEVETSLRCNHHSAFSEHLLCSQHGSRCCADSSE